MPIDIAWLQQAFPSLQNLQVLGRGGQKEVFSALHASDGDVVLKLINPQQETESVRREILAVARVQSPRVPRILDQGQLNTKFGTFIWLREQRILGDSLRQVLGKGPLTPQEVIRLGVQMLEALSQAETVQIVHRDVKPENIMRDGHGNYWLLDFGIARHLTLPSMTPTAAPFGKFTLGYSSPEQCRNLKPDIDSRADLFALGVTLYECGTGTNPFLTPLPANDLEKLRRVEILPMPPLVIGISGPELMRDFIQAVTQKRRDLRPRSAQAALDWMREIDARQRTP
ncbi:MAG TPA: serine/threonine-protein kinase [Armatimonadota bacterium]|nr:serine/threonine-protein kinase [Armatimonadota bacterium]